MTKVICTEASQSHLGQLLVLIDSILAHEAALHVYLLVIDIDREESAALAERILAYLGRGNALALTLLSLDQLYGERADRLRFLYDPFELCMVGRGGMHKWLMEHTEHETWLHLDADMYCFAPLDGIFAKLQQCDILLSAHRDSPPATAEEDLTTLAYGAYNGGLLGLRRSESARKFANWFHDRLLDFGRVDTWRPLSLQPDQRLALFGDQSWLVPVPMYFDNVFILKDRGTNFGPWSLGTDETFLGNADGTGQPAAGGSPITILHLSGWRRDAPQLLSYYIRRDLSDNAFWRSFTSRYITALEQADAAFFRGYRYAKYADGTPVTIYHRRAFLKLCLANKQPEKSPFHSRQLIDALAADFNTYDYAPPGMALVTPDAAFPNMVEGNRQKVNAPFLRREVPHKWYVDARNPANGFVSREEALILYNTARLLPGAPALEIGCWLGWSACHLALGGVVLDVVDPMLDQPAVSDSVTQSLAAAGVLDRCRLHAGESPQAVREIAVREGKRWKLFFIDGSHQAPGPLEDARIAAEFADDTALILFHDLAFPDVEPGLAYLRSRGWNVMIYQTMQIMGVAWRGQVQPLRHVPDPNVSWWLPPWLHSYPVSA